MKDEWKNAAMNESSEPAQGRIFRHRVSRAEFIVPPFPRARDNEFVSINVALVCS